MDLKEKVRDLPSSPGVYLMKDSLNTIIYVGKSKNLKSRVGSYFQNSKAHSPKVLKLVKNIRDFEYILTDTEFEAFMLECKLIKEIKPIYNKQMKSPLSYAYIKIDMHEKYPRIDLSYECIKDDKNLYFGPYTSRNTVERAIQGIKKCCKILCSNPAAKGTSCLNYSLGLCIGICLDETLKKEYDKIIHKIVGLLNGSDESVLKEMEHKMLEASEKFDFETAAEYRDYISAVNSILSKEKVIEFTAENKNIVLIEYLNDSLVKAFLIKGNSVLFSEKYSLKDYNFNDLKEALLSKIMYYFNVMSTNSSIEIGKEELDEAQIIYSYLNSKKSSCKYVIIDEQLITNKNNRDIKIALDNILTSLI